MARKINQKKSFNQICIEKKFYLFIVEYLPTGATFERYHAFYSRSCAIRFGIKMLHICNCRLIVEEYSSCKERLENLQSWLIVDKCQRLAEEKICKYAKS